MGNIRILTSKVVVFIALMCCSISVHAHGLDYSVLRLSKMSEHTLSLTLTSSLDAFRKEVRQHFSKSPYATPEEFNEQLLAHIKKTLLLTGENKQIALGEGTVTLGHETSVVFRSVTLPKNLRKITLTNGAVKDIYRHATKLIVTAEKTGTQTHILNKSNDFTATFFVE